MLIQEAPGSSPNGGCPLRKTSTEAVRKIASCYISWLNESCARNAVKLFLCEFTESDQKFDCKVAQKSSFDFDDPFPCGIILSLSIAGLYQVLWLNKEFLYYNISHSGHIRLKGAGLCLIWHCRIISIGKGRPAAATMNYIIWCVSSGLVVVTSKTIHPWSLSGNFSMVGLYISEVRKQKILATICLQPRLLQASCATNNIWLHHS